MEGKLRKESCIKNEALGVQVVKKSAKIGQTKKKVVTHPEC